jgi:hypothetical protein
MDCKPLIDHMLAPSLSARAGGMARALVGLVRSPYSFNSEGSTMSRQSMSRFALLSLVVAVVACNDGMTAPRRPKGAPSLDVIVNHMSDDSTSADFTVTPTGGVFVIGKHAVSFPANSICDPQTSSYGETEWDAPCEPLTSDIQIHAEVRQLNGRTWVDFTPSLRFVPTDSSENYVWILMKSDVAATAPLGALSILWSPAIGEEGINEAVSDSTLRTYVWRAGGISFRRIKHFSGYNSPDGIDAVVETVIDALVSPIDF